MGIILCPINKPVMCCLSPSYLMVNGILLNGKYLDNILA